MKKIIFSFIFIFNLVLVASDKKLSMLDNLSIGTLTGIAEVTTGHPWDYLKLVIQEPAKYKFSLNPKILYRGYGSCASSYVPGYAVQFIVSEKLSEILKSKDKEHKISEPIKIGSKIFSDFLAGALSATVINPSQVIALQQQRTGQSLKDAIKEIYSANGIKGINRGFIPTSLRWGIFTASYLAINNIFKNKLKEYYDDLDKDLDWEQELFYILFAGTPSGALATILTQPFDVVKTRTQLDYKCQKYKNLREVVKELYKEDGLKSFTRGMGPRGIRVIQAVCLMGALTSWLKEQKLNDFKPEDQI